MPMNDNKINNENNKENEDKKLENDNIDWKNWRIIYFIDININADLSLYNN
jgi:hypothetical protein